MSIAHVLRRARGVYLADVAYLDGEDGDYDAFPSLKQAKAWCETRLDDGPLQWTKPNPNQWRGEPAPESAS